MLDIFITTIQTAQTASVIAAAPQPQTNQKTLQTSKKKNLKGTVYLLHFSEKYHHAGHYLGFAENFENRLEQHRNGHGSRLTQVITGVGIEFECVRTWDKKTRTFERQLKNRHDARALCPTCRAKRNEEKRIWKINHKNEGENQQ